LSWHLVYFYSPFFGAQLTDALVDKRNAARRKSLLPPLTTPSGSKKGWLRRAFGSKLSYADKLTKALQALISATDVVTTILLAQPNGYCSPYDSVYPTDYGRALTLLFDALLGVTFAPSVETTLELHGCPLMHLQESGLSLNEKVVKKVAAKFSRLSLKTHRMEYTLNPQATKRPQLGRQLIDGLRASGDHLKRLSFRGTLDWVPNQIIISEDDYPSLTHVFLTSVWISSTVFVSFISNRLPHLISLHASNIHFDEGEITWKEAFDIWRAVKKSVWEQGRELKLEHLNLVALQDRRHPASLQSYSSWVRQLCNF
jgi:hypothetical protein